MTDSSLIETLERALIKVQNSTGIPKWRILSVTLPFSLAFKIGERFSLYGWDDGLIGLNLVLLLIWFVSIYLEKEKQALADRYNMVVPSATKNSKLMATIRWIYIIIVISYIFLRGWLFIISELLFALSLYLCSCDTFPIVGPSLWQRIKNGLSKLRLVQTPAMNEG